MRGGQFKYNPDTQAPMTPVPWENESGVVWAPKRLILDYTGDATNDREIDLEDNYYIVDIVQRGNNAPNSDHLIGAWARDDAFGILFEVGGSSFARHALGVNASTQWQGKMTGADANKIKLGSVGAGAQGTNVSGKLYRIIGVKFPL